jgi:hypothetical protein
VGERAGLGIKGKLAGNSAGSGTRVTNPGVPLSEARGSGVLAADRATPKAGPLLATLLGASGGELEATAGAGGDPDAAEQMQGRLLGTSAPARAPTRRQGDGRVKGAAGHPEGTRSALEVRRRGQSGTG